MEASCGLTALLLFFGMSVLHSQELPDPNALRAPVVTSAPRLDARAQAARLILFKIRQALATGDTTVLVSLVPDSVIPRSEWTIAFARNCQSLPRIVTRVGALYGVRAPIMRYFVVDDLTAVTGPAGDTTIVGGVHFIRAGSVTRTASFTFVQCEGAVLLASVDGLVDELCRISIS